MNYTFSSLNLSKTLSDATVSPVLYKFCESANGVLGEFGTKTVMRRMCTTYNDGKDTMRLAMLSDWSLQELVPLVLEAFDLVDESAYIKGLPRKTNIKTLKELSQSVADVSKSIYLNNVILLEPATVLLKISGANKKLSNGDDYFFSGTIGEAAARAYTLAGLSTESLEGLKSSTLKILTKMVNL